MTQTRRIGTQNERRSGAKRPSLKGMLTERRGRDVGFAKSPLRLIAAAALPAKFDAPLPGSQPVSDGIVSILEGSFPLSRSGLARRKLFLKCFGALFEFRGTHIFDSLSGDS